MAGRLDNYQRWSAEATLLVGDANKTLQALPVAGNNARKRIVVTHLTAICLVSAAQTVDIKIGTVFCKRLPASPTVGTEAFWGPADFGIQGQDGQDLTIVPSAAGASWHVVAEGYYL